MVKQLKDIFGEPYSVQKDCGIGLKLNRIKEKDEGSFHIHRSTPIGKAGNVEVFNKSSEIDLEKTRVFRTEHKNEIIVEFKPNKTGVFKMDVTVNGESASEGLFVESKGDKESIEDAMTSTNQSINSRASVFSKRHRSTYKNGKNSANIFIKKDRKLIIKNGSIQPMRLKDKGKEIKKKTNIAELLKSKRGKLEKMFKGKKNILAKKKLN